MKKLVSIFFITVVLYAKPFTVASYNVENLFDTYDDSLTSDEEFLPEGDRYWNTYKYYQKINNIYKVNNIIELVKCNFNMSIRYKYDLNMFVP